MKKSECVEPIEYVDLLLINGDICHIEFLAKYYDDAIENMRNCIRRGDYWASGCYDGTKAEINGQRIDGLFTGKVVGQL
jgi:hypothetical protein